MKLEHISMSKSGHKVFISISEIREVAFYCFFIVRQLDKLDSDQCIVHPGRKLCAGAVVNLTMP